VGGQIVALSQGQLNYWRKRTQRPKLTMGQAAYQRAQAKAAPKAPAPPKLTPSPADTTWTKPNASGMTGQQQLYAAYMKKNPGAQLPAPVGGIPNDPNSVHPSNWQDSTYFTRLAAARLERQNKMTDLQTEDQSDLTGHQESLRRFREQLPRQEEQATEDANRAGLLYSGHLGKGLGDIRTQAIRQETDMQIGFDNRQRARAAARKALADGGTLEDAAMAAEAVDRAINRDSDAALSRSLVSESLIPPDAQDAGVDVGTPSPARGGRQNTNRTPDYLPRGYANWDQKRRSRYWAKRRKARKR
jgi:hypothetical protein